MATSQEIQEQLLSAVLSANTLEIDAILVSLDPVVVAQLNPHSMGNIFEELCLLRDNHTVTADALSATVGNFITTLQSNIDPQGIFNGLFTLSNRSYIYYPPSSGDTAPQDHFDVLCSAINAINPSTAAQIGESDGSLSNLLLNILSNAWSSEITHVELNETVTSFMTAFGDHVGVDGLTNALKYLSDKYYVGDSTFTDTARIIADLAPDLRDEVAETPYAQEEVNHTLRMITQNAFQSYREKDPEELDGLIQSFVQKFGSFSNPFDLLAGIATLAHFDPYTPIPRDHLDSLRLIIDTASDELAAQIAQMSPPAYGPSYLGAVSKGILGNANNPAVTLDEMQLTLQSFLNKFSAYLTSDDILEPILSIARPGESVAYEEFDVLRLFIDTLPAEHLPEIESYRLGEVLHAILSPRHDGVATDVDEVRATLQSFMSKFGHQAGAAEGVLFAMNGLAGEYYHDAKATVLIALMEMTPPEIIPQMEILRDFDPYSNLSLLGSVLQEIVEASTSTSSSGFNSEGEAVDVISAFMEKFGSYLSGEDIVQALSELSMPLYALKLDALQTLVDHVPNETIAEMALAPAGTYHVDIALYNLVDSIRFNVGPTPAELEPVVQSFMEKFGGFVNTASLLATLDVLSGHNPIAGIEQPDCAGLMRAIINAVSSDTKIQVLHELSLDNLPFADNTDNRYNEASMVIDHMTAQEYESFRSVYGDTVYNQIFLDSGDGPEVYPGVYAYQVTTGYSTVVYGGHGNDKILSLWNDGSAGDILFGNQGNDLLRGVDGGNDYLDGGAGNDRLYGHGGNDTLYGGDGRDVLFGNAGEDTFVFKAGDTLNDIIKDFNVNEDRIDISDLLQGFDPLTDNLSDFVLTGGYEQFSALYLDRDGQGGQCEFQMIVATDNGVDLEAIINTGNLIV